MTSPTARADAARRMPPLRCPVVACRSTRCRIVPPEHRLCQQLAQAWGRADATTHGYCESCHALWEVLPPGWCADVTVRAYRTGPCNTCAFRSTSYEMRDPAKRAEIVGYAEQAANLGPDETGTHFCCHKGIPIRVVGDPPTLDFDFAAAGIDPRGWTCGAFYLAVLAKDKVKARRDAAHVGPSPDPILEPQDRRP